MVAYVQARVLRPLVESQTLLVLCVTTVVVMMGQGIIAPLLPLYAKSFGVSTALAGLAISSFALARLLVNIPAGFLSERFGRRLLLVGGPVVSCVSYVFSGVAPTFEVLIAFRLLSGVGSAMYMTGAMIFLTDVTTEENRGRLMSIYQGSLLLGVSLGPAFGGLIADGFGLRAPFFVVAAMAAVTGVWSFVRMPETSERIQVAVAGEPEPGAEQPQQDVVAVIRSLVIRPEFILVSLLTMSIFLTRTGARLTLIPIIGAERLGLSFGALGAIFTMMTVLNLVALLPAGTFIDRLGRKAVIVPSALVTAAALLMFALSGSVWLFVVAGFIHGIGTGIVGPAPAAYAADIAPPGMRGIAMGIYRTFGDAGFVIGPLLLGWLADVSSFGWALSFNAALLLFFAFLFAVFARETVAGRSERMVQAGTTGGGLRGGSL
jgi:MFS family permease